MIRDEADLENAIRDAIPVLEQALMAMPRNITWTRNRLGTAIVDLRNAVGIGR